MRYFCYVVLPMTLLLLSSCTIPPPQPDAQTILQNSQSKHDPYGKWSRLDLQLHIQEPRVGNPGRYSKIHLNNASGTFQLERSRESSVATYQIADDGSVNVLLDGSTSFPDSLVQKYRLSPAGVPNYKRFYQVMYGLPMTLTEDFIAQLGAAEVDYYNNTACYKIPVTLQQELFSKDWNLYIAQKDFTFKGMEIIFPDNPEKGERLHFEGEMMINGVALPRFRHWYDLKDDTYLGSDIGLGRL